MINYDQKYADSERLLSFEGDSLAELLENFGERISPVLVSAEHRARLLSCAQQIPASAAALPFGFMLPLLQDPAGAVSGNIPGKWNSVRSALRTHEKERGSDRG